MEAKKHDRRDQLQNLLIVLLSVSAVLLFARTQVANLGLRWDPGRFSTLVDSGAPAASGAESGTLADLAAPVHVAVGNAHGRFGLTYTTTANTALSGLSTLLGSALGSSGELAPCQEADFRRALGENGVLFDFTGDLPLSVLAELLGASYANTDLEARLLLLSGGADGVRLYLLSEDGACWTCPTAVSASTLESELAAYAPNGAVFAYELGGAYGALAPYCLMAEPLPECPPLTASPSLTEADTNALLQQLSFNPHTNNRLWDKSGAQTIVEGTRALRQQADGSVTYQGDDGTLSVPAAGELPTLTEAVLGARQLAQKLLEGRLGEAALYLESARQADGVTTVRFGYLLDGVPIRFADGTGGAEFELTGAAVTHFAIRFRQYAAAEGPSLLLPLPQAVAVARATPGAQLTAAYVDGGASSLSAGWLAD